jgi:hypothetical protein
VPRTHHAYLFASQAMPSMRCRDDQVALQVLSSLAYRVMRMIVALDQYVTADLRLLGDAAHESQVLLGVGLHVGCELLARFVQFRRPVAEDVELGGR